MSYVLEVHGCGDAPDSYSCSAVRLETRAEAEAHGKELGSRWFGFDKSRVVESTDPVNYIADTTTGVLTAIRKP